MANSKFDTLFNTIMESINENTFDNDEDLTNTDTQELADNGDETVEPTTDTNNVIGEEDPNDEQDQDQNYDDQDGIDFSDMGDLTEEQAKQIFADWKANDDPINDMLITMENIFTKYQDEGTFDEFKEEFWTYLKDEWDMQKDDVLSDEQEFCFYMITFLVNNHKDDFESEEDWKRFFVLSEVEQQESQTIIYPTASQGRGMMDFILEYFNENQDYEDQDQEEDNEDQFTNDEE